MNRLTILTRFPEPVVRLLRQHQLVERHHIVNVQPGSVVVNYPDDALAQSLVLWFSLAKGCGLISDYDFQFVTHCA